MIERLKTAAWFAQRPSHWAHAVGLVVRKLRPDRDGPGYRQAAELWAAPRAVSVAEALKRLGLSLDAAIPRLPPALMEDARARAQEVPMQMGGPGDIDLLYATAKLSAAQRVIETGVAFGWSSLALLAGLEGRAGARLVSVDMPYPKQNNEAWVGAVVPDRLRGMWRIRRQPDRPGLERALADFDGEIDLCHYDSDKSWYGRRYAYPKLWRALRPGGVFISDDIQDNLAFAEFMDEHRPVFAVTRFDGKYVGVAVRS